MAVFSLIDDDDDDDDEVMTSPPASTPGTAAAAAAAGAGGGATSAPPLRESTDVSIFTEENQQQRSRLSTKKVMFRNQEGERNATNSTVKRKRQGTPYKPYYMSTLSSDETTEDPLVRAGEGGNGDDDILLKAADNAFHQMQIMEVTARVEKKRHAETDDFPDEGLPLLSSPKEQPSSSASSSFRFRMRPEDILKASDNTATTGSSILDRLTTSVVGSKTTNSNTDYGRRMGQSFRVGWGPDGTFLSIDSKTGRIITRSRPVFTSHTTDGNRPSDAKNSSGSSGSNVNHLALMETQVRRSIQIQSKNTVDGCPLHTIDLRAQRGRRGGQAETLEKTLTELAASSPDAESRDAFKLLNIVLQKFMLSQLSPTSPPIKDHLARRRVIAAITQWLVDSTSDDVEKELSKYHSSYDPDGMILSAVSGGNLLRAASVAEQQGYTELAVLLSSSSSCPESKKDIKQELHEWSLNGVNRKVPTKLLRAYHMIAGNESSEDTAYQRSDDDDTRFDWRRRMVIDLVYTMAADDKDLLELLQDYEVKITGQQAPFPVPRYMWGRNTTASSSEKIESVLYKILQFGAESPSLDPSTIFDPLGYGSNPHDFGLAFGLTTCMTALNSVVPRPCTAAACLDRMKSRELLDGYVANLVAVGRWDIAVWASIHFLSPDPSFVKIQSQQAKRLVLKHFDGHVESKNFLESIGIPQAWLNEAKAYRSGIEGDFFSYTSHIANVSVHKAREAMESNIVPNIIFMDNDQCSDFLSTLESISGSDKSLSKAILDLFDINKTIMSLDGCTADQLKEEVAVLKEACDDIESTLTKIKLSLRYLKKFPKISSCSQTDTVDMKYFVSEALRHVTLFRLQILALEHQKSIHASLSELLVLRSNLMTKDGTSGGLSTMDIDSSASLRAFL